MGFQMTMEPFWGLVLNMFLLISKRFYVNPTVWGNWGKFQPGKQEQHVLNFLKPLPKPRKAHITPEGRVGPYL